MSGTRFTPGDRNERPSSVCECGHSLADHTKDSPLGPLCDLCRCAGFKAKPSMSDHGRYGPGCERHKGDPHNLCPACWALEPDPATLSVTQGGIGDTAGFFLPPKVES